MCSSPITVPSAYSLSSRPSGSLASSSSASSQPSRKPSRNSCRIPSVASIRRPSTSYQPTSEAMCGKPWALRKRSSSSSGFTPGSILRNAFMISWSPKTIEEFDCSTPTGRTSTVPPECRPGRVRRPAEDELVLADLVLAVGAHRVQQLAARRRDRRARRRPSSRRLRGSRARSSPPTRDAGRAAPGRSRASPRGSAPRRGRAGSAATRCAAGRSRRCRSARPRASWRRTSAVATIHSLSVC